MRTTVTPALPISQNLIDPHIRLVWTAAGPVFKSLAAIQGGRNEYRRVRNSYFTHDFAELLRFEMLANNARLKSVIPRLMVKSMENDNPASNLYPMKGDCWWPIVEDIFTSPAAEGLRQRLLIELVEHEEFECLSIDATLRCCMSIMGQAHHRASKQARMDAPLDDSHSVRRVLTVLGRTGAVVAMLPIPEENVDAVTHSLEHA